ESELESMASTVQTQNAALEQLREEVRSADAVNGTMQEMNGRNEMLQQTLDRLTGELESLRGQAASAGEADAVNAELRSEMTAVTIRAQNMENVLQERGRDLAAAHVEIARLMEELEEHRTEQARIITTNEKTVAGLETMLTELREQAARREAEFASTSLAWASERQELQSRMETLHSTKSEENGSAAKYASLVDEMSVTIAELEQKVQSADSRLLEYEELKKKSSKAPTLIEGMLRSDVESLSARVAQLEEERRQWSHDIDDAESQALSKVRKDRRDGIAEKLRTAISILERSVNSQ
ncbi:MAG: hypothetical protein ACKOAX_02580, partial [Candidatus Kapaibacterium sp.]